MEKVSLDLSYNDKNKKEYESFFGQLEKEGWKLENTFIDQRKGKGNYYYRTMIRRIVR
jgi:hypothetical protein